MLQLLDEFKDIIKSVTIEKYDVSGDNIKLRIKLLLVTNSWLYRLRVQRLVSRLTSLGSFN
ncbi:MAG: hypothetical protein QG657_1587 [Acidobacteriota bacterium]|nr:hypothetical protein [Acidobacteriota bacterium]